MYVDVNAYVNAGHSCPYTFTYSSTYTERSAASESKGARERRLSGSDRPAGPARIPGRTRYPFIPVSVIPWMKYFCAKKKSRITGSVIRQALAIIMP